MKIFQRKCELCGKYSSGAENDCVLFGFSKDVVLKEKWSEAMKLSMVNGGFLCQKIFRVGDFVFGKRITLLHGNVPSDVSRGDASRRLAGVLSVEYARTVGKREEEKRTCAKEKVVKELTEQNVVRMLKIEDVTQSLTSHREN